MCCVSLIAIRTHYHIASTGIRATSDQDSISPVLPHPCIPHPARAPAKRASCRAEEQRRPGPQLICCFRLLFLGLTPCPGPPPLPLLSISQHGAVAVCGSEGSSAATGEGGVITSVPCREVQPYFLPSMSTTQHNNTSTTQQHEHNTTIRAQHNNMSATQQ
eukprot:1142851-Pelagomonas_calceolata.AAC.6